SVGDARSSSRSSAATRMLDMGVFPLSSVTKPSVGSTVSTYFIEPGVTYLRSRFHSVRAAPSLRFQVIVSLESLRKRGSPPAIIDWPGSQYLPSAVMATDLRLRSAAAPPCAVTA